MSDPSEIKNQFDGWKIVEAFIRQNGLVPHQIQSYDDFLFNTIPAILCESDPLDITTPIGASDSKKQSYSYANPVSMIIPISPSNPEPMKHVFTFSNPLITPASLTEFDGSIVPMTPQIARLRKLTYQVSVFVQIQHDKYRIGSQELVSSTCDRVLLCNIPLMLNSELCITRNKSPDELYAIGECTNDNGGYFVVKGGEKCIVGQELAKNNMIYVFPEKSSGAQKTLAFARIYSSAEGLYKSTSQITVKWANVKQRSNLPTYVVNVQIPELNKRDIPLAILFKAMGVLTNEEISLRCGVSVDPLRSTLEEGWLADTQVQALDWIARKNGVSAANASDRRDMVMTILVKNLFPHIGGNRPEKIPEKGWFLGLMVNRLVRAVTGEREFDDRDHFGNKRVESTGSLIASLFKQNLNALFNSFVESVYKKLSQNKIINLNSEIDHAKMTRTMLLSFSTGNWNVSRSQKSVRTGVSQTLMRLSYVAMNAHLRKFLTSMPKEGKLAKPRQLHTSSWMRADPNETPEGEGCGLHKNLALLAHISLHTRTNITKMVLDWLTIDNNIPLLPFDTRIGDRSVSKLCINGAWVGNVQNGPYVASVIRILRRRGVIPYDTGIAYRYVDNEISISTDAGRLCRPVLIVENHRVRITPDIIKTLPQHTYPVNWLIRNGYAEYIDALEEEEYLIAITLADLEKYAKDHYTHCEIDPSLILGITSGLIGFSDHNPAIRITYSAQFFKQAMGMYTTNYQQRMDTTSHILMYPQRPIVSTKTSELIHFDDMPSGQMAVVALACYGGWNCEDSIIVNQSSVDRGLFRSITYKTYEAEEKKMTGNITEDFCMPDPNDTAKYNHDNGYHAIDCKDGLPIPGSKIMGGDVLVAKTHSMPTVYDPHVALATGLPSSGPSKTTKRDVSITLKKTEKGVVDKVMVSNSDEVKYSSQESSAGRSLIRQRFAKVRVRSVRVPELGDKIALSAPQKGTIGLLMRQEDMFYTKDGIVPDVVLNPSCFVGETLVSMINGLSRRIDQFEEEGGEAVWTFDEKSGFVFSKSLGMEYKGEKEVVRLTLQDGRELTCTPDHRLQVQTSESEFIFKEARNVDLKNDKIVMGIEYTEDKVFDDEEDWVLDAGDFFFRMDTPEERNKTLAFARILGYIHTDGYLSREGVCNTFHSKICLGQDLDAKSAADDIELVTGSRYVYRYGHHSFDINIGNRLATAIGRLEGMMNGRKTTQTSSLPAFLLDPECPKAVIREFLGGYFGGDGHAPYLNSKGTSSRVHLSKSICVEYQESLVQNMNHIIEMLGRLGVEANLVRIRPCPVQSELYKEQPRNQVEIAVKSNQDFLRYVGFRHCLQKSYRLSLAVSYERYYDKTLSQAERLLNLVNKMIDERPKTSVRLLLEEAREQMYKNETPLHTFYSLLDLTHIHNRRRAARKDTPMLLKHPRFPTFETYLKEIGCDAWFKRDDQGKMNYITKIGYLHSPHYTLSLIGRHAAGIERVYDIGVSKHHNLLANGVCAHNCIPSRMTTTQVFETLFGKTAALQGKPKFDSSVFSTDTKRALDMERQLKELGFEPHGNEVMYHGATGEMMKAKIFVGLNHYMRLKHLVADKMHCLTADHDVLTLDGWKPIADITMSDKVATLHQGEHLVYEHPINTLSFDHSGKMYHISNQAIDLDVTLNHRMYVKREKEYELVEASEIVGKDVYYKNEQNKDILVSPLSADHNEYTYDYTGKVYCLQVSSEVFMVRKNGKSVWTGNSRARGKVTQMFRQPTEGRSRGGGLRCGEMECSALTAHGVATFLRERLFYLSDEYSTYFCDRCGFFAVANFKKHSFKCDNCDYDKLNEIMLPYACKLLFQELMAMGIVPRVHRNKAMA